MEPEHRYLDGAECLAVGLSYRVMVYFIGRASVHGTFNFS